MSATPAEARTRLMPADEITFSKCFAWEDAREDRNSWFNAAIVHAINRLYSLQIGLHTGTIPPTPPVSEHVFRFTAAGTTPPPAKPGSNITTADLPPLEDRIKQNKAAVSGWVAAINRNMQRKSAKKPPGRKPGRKPRTKP